MKRFEIYQWLVPLICIYFVYRTIMQYVRHRKTPREAFIWILFWIVIAAIAIIPNAITNKLAALLGFKNNVTAIIFIGLGFLYLLVYNLYSLLNQVNAKLTDLVRKLAVDNAEE